MFRKLLFFFIAIAYFNTSFGQTKFTSSKYDYSFIFPDGWQQKNKIFNPDVDAKIVDGKGNSFIVSIIKFPTSTNLTATQQMENSSNKEIEEQLSPLLGETKILKRGSISIGFKEFYYIQFLTPFKDGLKLHHKQFFYSEGDKMMTIDACSIEYYLDEKTPSFAIMLSTFKFSNLKNK